MNSLATYLSTPFRRLANSQKLSRAFDQHPCSLLDKRDIVMPPCYLLDKLPPEVRDNIYELAFTFDEKEEHGAIDLTKATPPSKALLLTCRQIRDEASGIFKLQYRRFWETGRFFVASTGIGENAAYHITALNEDDVQHIRHLFISCQLFRGISTTDVTMQLLDARGGWYYQWSRQGGNMQILRSLWVWRPRDTLHSRYYSARQKMEVTHARDSTGWSLQKQIVARVLHILNSLSSIAGSRFGE